MFSSLPNKETVNNGNPPSVFNKRRKRKNKNKNKKTNKQPGVGKKVFKGKKFDTATKVVSTMSAWAENFTFAATWQLKHQLAYWKAKAKSLEYENGVLHDIIRRNHYMPTENAESSKMLDSESENDDELPAEEFKIDENVLKHEVKEGKLGAWQQNQRNKLHDHRLQTSDVESIHDGHNIEVSEEFIQFLMVNAKHKEEVRLQREKMKALEEAAEMEESEKKLKSIRHYGKTVQELYGDRWQKVTALEIAMKSDFITKIDSEKPAYWPVIPFNFDFS